MSHHRRYTAPSDFLRNLLLNCFQNVLNLLPKDSPSNSASGDMLSFENCMVGRLPFLPAPVLWCDVPDDDHNRRVRRWNQ